LLILIAGASSATNSEIFFIIYTLCGLIPTIFTSCSTMTIDSTNTKIWTYLQSMPISKKDIILSKYILNYSLMLLSYILIAITTSITFLFNGYSANGTFLLICFIIFSVIFIFTNVELPFVFKFGNAIAGGLLIIFIVFIIMAGLTIAVKCNLDNITGLFKHLNKPVLSCLLLLIDILSSFISYCISKKMIKLL
jgi:hypothetical protein